MGSDLPYSYKYFAGEIIAGQMFADLPKIREFAAKNSNLRDKCLRIEEKVEEIKTQFFRNEHYSILRFHHLMHQIWWGKGYKTIFYESQKITISERRSDVNVIELD